MLPFILNEGVPTNMPPPPVEGYLCFGNKDFAGILGKLCESNPFFASALSLCPREGDLRGNDPCFELKAFAFSEPTSGDSYYLKLMREIQGIEHKINVRFHSDMTVHSIFRQTSVDGSSTEFVEVKNTTEEWNGACSGCLYNVMHYASACHATIHILHYLATVGMVHATQESKALHAWSRGYDEEIALKYAEVAVKLFNDAPTAVVVGVDGIGATPAAKPILKDMLINWGKCATANDFLKEFVPVLFSGESKPEGILTEFLKHTDVIPAFAAEMTGAMKEHSTDEVAVAESKLGAFMMDCGDFRSSTLGSFVSWIEVMSITGIIHGSTLSYTRLHGVPEMLRWRKRSSASWDTLDLQLMHTLLACMAISVFIKHDMCKQNIQAANIYINRYKCV